MSVMTMTVAFGYGSQHWVTLAFWLDPMMQIMTLTVSLESVLDLVNGHN